MVDFFDTDFSPMCKSKFTQDWLVRGDIKGKYKSNIPSNVGLAYEKYSKSIGTKAVFTHINMNNEQNIHFLQYFQCFLLFVKNKFVIIYLKYSETISAYQFCFIIKLENASISSLVQYFLFISLNQCFLILPWP